MNNLSIIIKNKKGEVLAKNNDNHYINLVYKDLYNDGDVISFICEKINTYYIIQLDDAIDASFVYMAKNHYDFTIPFFEKKVCYSQKAFSGDLHLLKARVATSEEISQYKNLAKNEHDLHENTSCFPHASANVETRGESVFAAKNAINGNVLNTDHGKWPYESWGINQNPEAEIIISFGRTVEIDKAIIFLRADFPHDNFWEKITLSFSDNTSIVVDLIKTHIGQTVMFEPKKVEWVKLSELIKSDDVSPFPALTQIEIYGTEVTTL